MGERWCQLERETLKRSVDSSGSLNSIEHQQKHPSGRDETQPSLFGTPKTLVGKAVPAAEDFMRHSAENAASLKKLAQMAEDRNAMMLFGAAPESQQFCPHAGAIFGKHQK